MHDLDEYAQELAVFVLVKSNQYLATTHLHTHTHTPIFLFLFFLLLLSLDLKYATLCLYLFFSCYIFLLFFTCLLYFLFHGTIYTRTRDVERYLHLPVTIPRLPKTKTITHEFNGHDDTPEGCYSPRCWIYFVIYVDWMKYGR